MKSRVTAAIIAGMLAVGLAGCSGTPPKPSPTPTPPFASADAAYKAAEATYKGYVDAGNRVDLSDEKSFEPVYSWLLGDALDAEKKSLTAMSSRGWTVGGATVLSYAGHAVSPDPRWGDVSLDGCINVANVTLLDAEGKSVVNPHRSPMQATTATFVRDKSTTTGLKIIKIKKRRDGAPCG